MKIKSYFKSGFYDIDRIKTSIFPRMIWDDKLGMNAFESSLCIKIIKKDILINAMESCEKVDIFFNEDSIITFTMMNEVKRLFILEECLYHYRQRESDQLASYFREKDFLNQMYLFYNYMIEVMGEQFREQIEKFYLKTVNSRYKIYSNSIKRGTIYYPFDVLDKDSSFIIYGAGDYGIKTYNIYKKTGYGKLVAWVDKNYKNIERDIRIEPPEIVQQYEYDFILIGVYPESVATEIIEQLVKAGVDRKKLIWGRNELSYLPNGE